MNRSIPILSLVFLFAASPLSWSAEDGVIIAKEISGAIPSGPEDAAWRAAPAVSVALYPQRSVLPRGEASKPAALSVQALYTQKELALRLEWDDPTQENRRDIGQFADAAGIQWPVRQETGAGLPYIGMGNPGSPVALWLWRADGPAETLAAEGFGSLTAQPPDGVEARGQWQDGKWRVVFRRALAASGEHALRLEPMKLGQVPIAFTTWDGAVKQRNGDKKLSAWQYLKFENGAPPSASMPRAASGNAETGRRLIAEKGCAGCHSYPGNPAAPAIGPDLSFAGGIHSADYLRESLRDPSKIVVPGKGFFITQEGRRTSIMPPFEGSKQEYDDLLAFLKTLR